MSGFARVVGTVAGVVAGAALVATGVGGLAGASLLGASLSSIANVAGVVATLSTAASGLLAGGPRTQGQVNERIIGANNRQPYLMGTAYTGGVEVYDVGWGGEVDDVDNPYRFIATVHSCCGPLESLQGVYLDFVSTSFSGSFGTVQEAVGYYEDYFYIDAQLGARPESNALGAPAGSGGVPNWGSIPDWGASYKLSGMAAIGYSMEWSKKGKRFAGGQLPVLGAVWQGVKVYDPRLDSTRSGGSGSHRIDNEATWTWSANPALHAATYAYGRIMNGVPVFGVRLFDDTAIDWDDVVAWANTCDTNGWTVNGTIYEPGDKWNNLQRICEAGGGVPVLRGGVLGFDYQAPRTSLYTVTRDDLSDGPIPSRSGKGWKTRQNTLVPRFRSAAHEWEYVQAAEVQVAAWVTADGEEKSTERQWDLVTDVDQVTELGTYDLYQRREEGPIVLPCKSHMRAYAPGDCLTLAAELGVKPGGGSLKAVVRRREVDLLTGRVTLEFEADSDAKHIAALGLTGFTQATRTLPSSQDLQDTRFKNGLPAGYTASLIRTAAFKNPRDASNVARSLLVASESSGTVTISVAKVDVDYAGEDSDVTFAVEDITTLNDGTTPIAFETLYYPYFDYDPLSPSTPPTYGLATTYTAAQNSTTNPLRHALGTVVTPASGSGGSTGGDSTGIGSGYDPNKEVP